MLALSPSPLPLSLRAHAHMRACKCVGRSINTSASGAAGRTALDQRARLVMQCRWCHLDAAACMRGMHVPPLALAPQVAAPAGPQRIY